MTQVPISAAASETKTVAPLRPRRYLNVHHNNIVNIDGSRHANTEQQAGKAGPQSDAYSPPPALIIALGLVAATQLSVIFLRVFTL